MELGSPLKLIYLTKFTKILRLYVFLRGLWGKRKVKWLQVFQIFQSWKIREKPVYFVIWYHQPRGLLSTPTNDAFGN